MNWICRLIIASEGGVKEIICSIGRSRFGGGGGLANKFLANVDLISRANFTKYSGPSSCNINLFPDDLRAVTRKHICTLVIERTLIDTTAPNICFTNEMLPLLGSILQPMPCVSDEHRPCRCKSCVFPRYNDPEKAINGWTTSCYQRCKHTKKFQYLCD